MPKEMMEEGMKRSLVALLSGGLDRKLGAKRIVEHGAEGSGGVRGVV